jgi:hypothetical protein
VKRYYFFRFVSFLKLSVSFHDLANKYSFRFFPFLIFFSSVSFRFRKNNVVMFRFTISFHRIFFYFAVVFVLLKLDKVFDQDLSKFETCKKHYSIVFSFRFYRFIKISFRFVSVSQEIRYFLFVSEFFPFFRFVPFRFISQTLVLTNPYKFVIYLKIKFLYF